MLIFVADKPACMNKDINSPDDIRLLVDTFYGEIQKDNLLGGIFMGVIKDWPKHLEKMYGFWQSILFSEDTYRGQSFEPHRHLPVERKHFDRWLALWRKTVDAHFCGERAEEAKNRAEKIAEVFWYKIDYLRNNKV